jgi:hypothetical protein
VIDKKTIEDFKAVAFDILGQSKNLGQGNPPVHPNHAFGIEKETLMSGMQQYALSALLLNKR